MPSARDHLEVVSNYTAAELGAGRMIGPLHPGETPGIHINQLGDPRAISQGNGGWSQTYEGASVNDGIPRDLCSLRYTSVKTIMKAAQSVGEGTLLAKLDVKSA